MPEIGSSGLMSGDGKRGVGHRPQATAPILDSLPLRKWSAYMRPPLSRVFRWCLAISIALVTDVVRGQAPQPRSGAPKTQGLRVRHIRSIILVIANTSCSIAPAFV